MELELRLAFSDFHGLGEPNNTTCITKSLKKSRKSAGGRTTASGRFICIDEASRTAPKSDVDRWHVSDDRSERRTAPAKGTFCLCKPGLEQERTQMEWAIAKWGALVG